MLEMEATPSVRHPATSRPLPGRSAIAADRFRHPGGADGSATEGHRLLREHPEYLSPGSGLLATIRAWLQSLQDPASSEDLAENSPDYELVDLLRVLEELKSSAAAVQARAAAVLDASQRRAQSRAGVPAAHLGRGVGAQIALARRDSPHRGSRHLGLGKALVHEMPHTLAALASGVLTEWRATLLVRETACLDLEDRHRVDELICKDPDSLDGLGDRKLIARIRSITQAIDPASQVRRNAKAVSDRYVSCRPAPDTMCFVTGLLPVAQGVAVYAALSRAADSLRASGDARSRGQIMADTLVERVTGQAAADRVPVEVQLVITDRTLFTDRALFTNRHGETVPGGDASPGRTGAPVAPVAPGRLGRVGAPVASGRLSGVGVPVAPGGPGRSGTGSLGTLGPWDAGGTAGPLGGSGGDAPAYFPGYGIVPGGWARDLIRSALGLGNNQQPCPAAAGRQESPPGAGAGAQASAPPDEQRTPVTLRRLYLDPVSGELTAMESKARAFPAGLARMIRTRDQTCRTPWCDAPIRHIDHIEPHAEGGPTSYANGQGLCEACNQAKEAPGWNSSSTPVSSRRNDVSPRHTVRTTTPTGHTYISTAPPLPGNPAVA
ncbi:HNH endonuclease [Arthrobacter koreensis]|uniref:HNH endonuclease n=1 Tax=Arthrobacter koreensis TaxID=199136 RepID=UPI0036DBEA05